MVTATDTTRGELVRLPWDYERLYGLDPDTMPVADAVRASASIPFFFEPVHLRAADGMESTLVDGGVLSNFPIDLLDRRDGRPPRWPTLGLKLLPVLPGQADRLLPGLGLIQHGPVGLAADLVTTVLVGRDQSRLSLPWVSARTIRIDTGPISPVNSTSAPERARPAVNSRDYRASPRRRVIHLLREGVRGEPWKARPALPSSVSCVTPRSAPTSALQTEQAE